MPISPFDKVSQDEAFREMFVRGRRRQLARNQVVLHEGEAPRALYFTMSGSLAVRLSNWRSHEVLLAYLHPGDFFGEMCLSPAVPARSAMVRTLTECQVVELAYEQFIELAARHPSLWQELAGQLAQRLRTTNRRLADMPILPAAERVWSVLAELAERALSGMPQDEVEIRITREDLGKLAGCSREACGAIVRQFAGDGLLNLRGHRIVVPTRALQPAAPPGHAGANGHGGGAVGLERV